MNAFLMIQNLSIILKIIKTHLNLKIEKIRIKIEA
jgi:hypothetical protein